MVRGASRSRAAPAPITNATLTAPMNWMARLERVFDIDLSQRPNCGARLCVIGEVTNPNVIARIVVHACPRRGCKRVGSRTMAQARRRCRSSAKPIPFTTLCARLPAPMLADFLVRRKGTYAFDRTHCRPAHRAFGGRIKHRERPPATHAGHGAQAAHLLHWQTSNSRGYNSHPQPWSRA